MSFWSSEILKKRNEDDNIITPFEANEVKHGAYQLRLGSEYYLTSDDPQEKRILPADGQVTIHPGQFALLLTKETLQTPLDSIAFISIRARYKLHGLINVSGFHVDPGFKGKLKFGVYNAGAQKVTIDADTPMFSIWFCNFVEATKDAYNGHWGGTKSITADDVMKLQGEVSSPGQLSKEIERIRNQITNIKWAVGAIFGALVAVATGIIVWAVTESANPTPVPNSDAPSGAVSTADVPPEASDVDPTNGPPVSAPTEPPSGNEPVPPNEPAIEPNI
ncbi:MAG: dCTP deaminase domain-containing protein [Phycisphaeraceae bacterium]